MPSYMLNHMSLKDFERLTAAHEEVRAIDAGDHAPESFAATEPAAPTVREPRGFVGEAV